MWDPRGPSATARILTPGELEEQKLLEDKSKDWGIWRRLPGDFLKQIPCDGFRVSIVMGVPNNGWFIGENPIQMDDDWGYPHFRKHPFLFFIGWPDQGRSEEGRVCFFCRKMRIIVDDHLLIWGFPKVGGTPSHHPFLFGIFLEINHPAIGVSYGFPMVWGTPFKRLRKAPYPLPDPQDRLLKSWEAHPEWWWLVDISCLYHIILDI